MRQGIERLKLSVYLVYFRQSLVRGNTRDLG
jgi:hypothetical protein